ncbi:MAG TPA: ABC transporter substrate-binding protein [Acetobacteraceae bacterium]|nr:ABC transporter substrate-binding protein [Acetobacteraceae bacterium]
MRAWTAAVAVAGGLLLAAGPAGAEDLYVAGYGGSYETILRQKVFPAFEKAHNTRIEYVAGNSTDTLAKLQAQKGHPDLDVAIMDDGPMYQAKALGFCAKLQPGPAYAQVYDIAHMGDDAVATGIVATGLAYDARAFERLGWKPPASWTDFADPKYKGKIAMPGIDNTYGLQALIMYARLNGGGVENIDPGFEYMIHKIAPNIRAFESSPGRMSELFQSGEIVAAIWGSGRVNALADTGFPIKFVYPKEGAMALFTAECPVAGARHAALAQQFVDYMLSADVQRAVAEAGNGPVNKTVELPPAVAARVPYGPAQIAKLVALDWTKVNQQRDAWTKRWNREVER